jgi:hypothetical protein
VRLIKDVLLFDRKLLCCRKRKQADYSTPHFTFWYLTTKTKLLFKSGMKTTSGKAYMLSLFGIQKGNADENS